MGRVSVVFMILFQGTEADYDVGNTASSMYPSTVLRTFLSLYPAKERKPKEVRECESRASKDKLIKELPWLESLLGPSDDPHLCMRSPPTCAADV